MKLPPDYKMWNLAALRMFVQANSLSDQTLEMSTEQYNIYKRLVFEADFIRRFDGIEIVVPKEQPKSETATLPLNPEDDGPNAPGNLL